MNKIKSVTYQTCGECNTIQNQNQDQYEEIASIDGTDNKFGVSIILQSGEELFISTSEWAIILIKKA